MSRKMSFKYKHHMSVLYVIGEHFKLNSMLFLFVFIYFVFPNKVLNFFSFSSVYSIVIPISVSLLFSHKIVRTITFEHPLQINIS